MAVGDPVETPFNNDVLSRLGTAALWSSMAGGLSESSLCNTAGRSAIDSRPIEQRLSRSILF
jgi:hypothetical protein